MTSKLSAQLKMKIVSFIFLCFFLFVSIKAQEVAPPIGIIDFYGLRTISESQARAALQLKEGDNLPASKTEIEKRLAALPNVVRANLNIVCCEAGKTILYIGLEEKGTATLQFRPAPRGKIRLPDEIIKTADEFYEALKKAALKGDATEDDSQGHALMKNAEARVFQEKFIPFANSHLKLLREVLYQSAVAEQRAIAAQIIAYNDDKKSIVKDLVYGVKDADEGVRNNSMRALGVLAGYALKNPEKNIKVPVEPFADMLSSIEWTDRNKSSMALWQLTAKRDKTILLSLRRTALPALIEMSGWKSFGHAFPAFAILARIADLPEDEIIKMWKSGGREELIEKVKNLRPEK